MKRIGVLFVVGVFAPSLVLGWLAARSIHDQRLASEHQRALLLQGIADRLALSVANHLSERQRDFGLQVEALMATTPGLDLAQQFDRRIRQDWPLAEVGFAVSLQGEILSPSILDGPEARTFRVQNSLFLCNAESVEVYAVTPKGKINLRDLKTWEPIEPTPKQAFRNVLPHPSVQDSHRNPSNTAAVTTAHAEFRQLVGDAQEGVVARFLENQLHLLLWYRPSHDPSLVFGAQLNRDRFAGELTPLLELEPRLAGIAGLAVLDEHARPVARLPETFDAPWRRPFAAAEIGETLPHWEAAVYLLDPDWLHSGSHFRALFGTLIAVLLVAIAVGGWLIVSDLQRQLRLARLKTDFVSNVSHELKTPLTSINLFAEMLATGRVESPAKQRDFLGIISTEAARLTRLINQVLDFSRFERGHSRLEKRRIDLRTLVEETLDACKPQSEAAGMVVEWTKPGAPAEITGDRDALAQVIHNLLSNAFKYARSGEVVRVELDHAPDAVELRVLDRGPGIPAALRERVFEEFFRIDDSLSSGIPGSGLGLALARRIARAHGGGLAALPRTGGGACFQLRLPRDPENA